MKKVSEMDREEILKYIADICGIHMYQDLNDVAHKKIALKLEELLLKDDQRRKEIL